VNINLSGIRRKTAKKIITGPEKPFKTLDEVVL